MTASGADYRGNAPARKHRQWRLAAAPTWRTGSPDRALLRQLLLQPAHDHVADLVLGDAGGAAHVVALGVDARLLRIAVLHEEVDVLDRCLVVELAVDAEERGGGLIEQAHVEQREPRHGGEKLLERPRAHGAAARFEQARRAEPIGGAAGSEWRTQPFLLEAVVHVAAVEHRTLDALRLGEGEPRRPIAAEAAAPDTHAGAVDVAARGEMIEPGGKGALGRSIAVPHGVLARTRHVHRQGGDGGAVVGRDGC